MRALELHVALPTQFIGRSPTIPRYRRVQEDGLSVAARRFLAVYSVGLL